MIEPAPSTALTRVALPLAILWSGLLLSAFVYSRLPENTQLDPLRGFISFLAVPAISLVGFGAIRLARRKVGAVAGRGEDLVVAWVMTFLLGMHCLVLALSVGMIDSLERALPFATALLFVGLGPVLATLEHKSAMGIRTRATLASPAAWASTHRLLGWLFPIAGMAGLSAWWLSGWAALAVAVLPGVTALAAVIAYGQTRAISPVEHGAAESRPNEDERSP